MTENENLDLLNCSDASKTEQLIKMFNLDIQKRNIIRATKLSDVQDLITEQMIERVTKHPGEFSNKDLIEYFKSVQSVLQSQNDADVTVPNLIQNNTVNVTMNENTLTSESRMKILNAVNKIITSSITDNVVDLEDIN